MKPLHELAVIKDGNELKGFVLGHEKYLIDNKKKIYTHINIVNMDEMNVLVKNNMVQYFEWDSSKNKIKISYNDEEIRDIDNMTGKAGISMLKYTKTLKDYIKNDVVFKFKHIQLIKDNLGVAGSLVNYLRMPMIGGVYSIIIYGDNNFGDMLNNWIKNQDVMIQKQINPLWIQKDNATITVSENVYVKLAYALNICTYVSTVEKDKPSGLVGMMYGSQKSIMEAYNKIEPLNKKIYEIAIQGKG